MPATKKSTAAQLTELKRENAALKAKLQKQTKPKRNPGQLWRMLAVIVCGGLAGAVLVSGNILFWVGRTAVDTDRYVAAVGPLVEQPEIQQALVTKTTTELFERVNVEQLAIQALPERAQFLAGPISDRVVGFVNDKALVVVSSQEFENLWYSVNQQAHQRLISAIKNSTSDGTINISDVYARLSQRLKEGPLAFLADKQLPSNIGSITVLEVSWLPTARWIVNNLAALRILSILLFIGLSFGAIMAARDRRKTVIRLGLVYATVMAATLLALNIARQLTLNNVANEYQAAANTAWQTITVSFVLQTAALMLAGLVMALLAWLAGSSRSATNVKSRVDSLISGKFHSSIFKKENAFTLWVGQARNVLIWLVVAGVGVTLLFVQLRPRIILAALLLVAIGVLIIELFAAPKTAKRR